MDILQLQKNLDELAAWRKRELFQANSLAVGAANEEARRYLCRAWVLMLYAHCDNFLKESSKQYICFLKSNHSDSALYKPELIWLAMKGKEALTDGSEETYKIYTSFGKINPQVFFDILPIKEIFDKRSFKYKSLRFVCDWILQIDFNHQELSGFCNAIKEKRDSLIKNAASI